VSEQVDAIQFRGNTPENFLFKRSLLAQVVVTITDGLKGMTRKAIADLRQTAIEA
jgi:hypothetical protein